ncbi:MFS transporter [Halalkalibacter sp. APA_J-10(15)]|uniref:MFS transporter n=1 Tax=Halalkalibacter sp. APA_J-10(15) TaxID=2933805 RepID=UPI001FF42813|nr:MFS transporter [Halalkalibacter sp. APA_J-10(15)]MCK0471837.1 MFS transporter [Halalkalibacter sp. APA_J-10(15)]
MVNRFQSFFYGWIIVFIAGLAVFFSGPGQTYSNSIYITEYIDHFGWSNTEISSIYSIATFCAGILMMFVGRMVDKIGQKKMLIFAGVALGLACFYNSIVSNIWMMAIGFFFIRLFGQGSMTLIPNTLVPQWFIQKRGRALSFMAIGGFASAAFFPLANAWLIQRWDWQTSWQVWGALLLFLFVPLVILFVRNKPEDIGLKPDGLTLRKNKNQKQPIPIAEVDWTLQEARKTLAFWALIVCVGIPALVNTAITFHLVSIFRENHITPEIAATVLSLMAIIGFPISLISGFILEKVKTRTLLIVIFILETVLLLLLLITQNALTAIIFGVIWGMASGLERITINIVWPNYFGRKYLGSIKGVAVTVTVVASSFGPLPLGVGYDVFQSYTQALVLIMLFPIIGLIAATLAKKPVKEVDSTRSKYVAP